MTSSEQCSASRALARIVDPLYREEGVDFESIRFVPDDTKTYFEFRFYRPPWEASLVLISDLYFSAWS